MRIRAENISKKFKDADRTIEVLSDVSLEVEPASTLALVGESGVGKTTLLQILGTLERPTSGNVFIGSECVTSRDLSDRDISSFRGKNIGFVFQFHCLLPEFDAIENVAMPLIIQGQPRSSAYDRAETLLNRVGLGSRVRHRPAALSGGEQQRVAIARALSAEPGVVLADEPTGNLDYRTGLAVQELLFEVQQEIRMTLVVVTHSLELARSMHRVIEITPSGLIERT